MSSAAILPSHQLTTQADHYGGRITNIAKCSCGKPLTWVHHDEEHLRHVLAVVWEEGYAKACQDHGGYTSCGTEPDPHNASHTNPYKEET